MPQYIQYNICEIVRHYIGNTSYTLQCQPPQSSIVGKCVCVSVYVEPQPLALFMKTIRQLDLRHMLPQVARQEKLKTYDYSISPFCTDPSNITLQEVKIKTAALILLH